MWIFKLLGADQYLQHNHHEQPERRGDDSRGCLDARLYLLRLWRPLWLRLVITL